MWWRTKVLYFCRPHRSPGGGIGRRVGLKHRWGDPCRFEPGPGYNEDLLFQERSFFLDYLKLYSVFNRCSWIKKAPLRQEGLLGRISGSRLPPRFIPSNRTINHRKRKINRFTISKRIRMTNNHRFIHRSKLR